MKFKVIIILSLFFMALESREMRHSNMGYLTDGMNDIKYKDTRIAFGMWMEDLTKEYYIDVNLIYYDVSSEIIKDFVDAKLHYLSINPIFYLENQKIIDSSVQDFWTVRRGVKDTESYIVLVRENSGIHTLRDLKNKTIATRGDNYLGKMYLDSELLKAIQEDSQGYISEYIHTGKFSTALLNVFFGKADACIVSEHTLNIVAEMNPAIKSKLRILDQSEEIFFPILAMFHKKAEKSIMNDFKANVAVLKDSARGRNILDLFKMEGMYILPREEMIRMKKYYNNYLMLRNKYAKQ